MCAQLSVLAPCLRIRALAERAEFVRLPNDEISDLRAFRLEGNCQTMVYRPVIRSSGVRDLLARYRFYHVWLQHSVGNPKPFLLSF